MILQTLSQTGSTFVVGILLASLFYGLARLAGKAYENSLRRERERPKRFEEIDFSGEIRVIGGGRRGPERIAGPESRTDRLPYTGRVR
jgi:hypothetical protein